MKMTDDMYICICGVLTIDHLAEFSSPVTFAGRVLIVQSSIQDWSESARISGWLW